MPQGKQYPPEALVCWWQSCCIVEIVDIWLDAILGRMYSVVDENGVGYSSVAAWLVPLTPAAQVFLREAGF